MVVYKLKTNKSAKFLTIIGSEGYKVLKYLCRRDSLLKYNINGQFHENSFVKY